jgi:hypothetical protein
MTLTKHEAHRLLAGLRVGDPVLLHRDGKALELTVQQELHKTDGGGFGSWDHAAVSVGYGPGRYNTEISAATIAVGYAQLTLPTDQTGENAA